jgi:AcrR family transcriptional regulator
MREKIQKNSSLPTIDRLINSVFKIVRAKGIDFASVRAITSGAGVTEATLYRYVDNKDELLELAWVSYFKKLLSINVDYSEFIEKQPVEVLRKLVSNTYLNYENNPEAFSYVVFADATKSLRDKYMNVSSLGEGSEIFLIHPMRDSVKNLIESLTKHHSSNNKINIETSVPYYSAILLSIPREIENNRLGGPASLYVESTVESICNLLLIKYN